LLLHHSHTDNKEVRENFPVAANNFDATNFLTGPHTFIAISSESSPHLTAQFKLERDKSVSS